MKLVALDSSGLVASVAVLEDDNFIAEYTIQYKKTHSQTLLCMLDEVKKMTELDLSTIDAIAIASGPGSFTGLRIGSATAKGLGLALDIPIIEVPTVEGMAYRMYGTGDIVCPMMDARRNEVYTGLFAFHASKPYDEMETVLPQCAIPVAELIARCNALGRRVVFLGDGVPVYKEMLEQGLTVPYGFAPPHLNRQSALAVGSLGMRYYEQGKYVTADQHAPDYLRLSQAERERREKRLT